MKQQINRETIKADLLSQKSNRAKADLIRNGYFRVIEDLCVDDLHSYGDSGSLRFKLSGRQVIGKNELLFPRCKNYFEVERFLSSSSWLYKRMYLVFVGDETKASGVYDCSACVINDVELTQKAAADPLLQTGKRGTISMQLLRTLADTQRKHPENNRYAIHRVICNKKCYDNDPESSISYEAGFSNGEINIHFYFKSGAGVVEANGALCSDDGRAFNQCVLNELYYIAEVNDTPKYIFAARDWKLSAEFVGVPVPPPKPLERRAYLQEIQPLIEEGVFRELYGNNRVSVLNLANNLYAITDYRKDEARGQFVIAVVSHSLVRLLFNHPKELPLIMSVSKKVRLQKILYDEQRVALYRTQMNGPSTAIDPDMEQQITALGQQDIYAPQTAVTKDDWLRQW